MNIQKKKRIISTLGGFVLTMLVEVKKNNERNL